MISLTDGNLLHGGSAHAQRAERRLVACPCCGGHGLWQGETCETCAGGGRLAPSEVERALATMARLGLRSEVARAAA